MTAEEIALFRRYLSTECQTKEYAFYRLPRPGHSAWCLLEAIGRKGGRLNYGHTGIDFGGHSNYMTLVTSLVRKGILSRDGNDLVLVEGEPLAVSEAKFPKPYLRVGRKLLSLVVAGQLQSLNTVVWLDPRGDALFHIVIPDPDMAQMLDHDSRTRQVEDYRTVCGASLAEVTERAEALAREYLAQVNGQREEVLIVSFATPTGARQEYGRTGLELRYDRLVLLNRQDFFRETITGGLAHVDRAVYGTDPARMRAHYLELGKVVIPYTPEREAALASLVERLEAMAAEFRRIITAADLDQLLDSQGQGLLGYMPAPDRAPAGDLDSGGKPC